MPISLECECGRKFRVKDEASGKKVRCPDCQKVHLVAPADDIPVEEPDAWESSDERRPPIRAKKARSKSRGGMPVRTLIITVVAICTFLIASYFGYQFLGGKKTANANSGSPATSISQSTKSLYQRIQFPLPSVNPLAYGGPAPGNLIISPLLVLEMELMEVHRDAIEKGYKPNENDPNYREAMSTIASNAKNKIRPLIFRLRMSTPELFCHSEAHEALLASGDEQTMKSSLEEYRRLYPLAKRELFELPSIIESCHPTVESGEATIGRVEAMIHLLNGELDQSRKRMKADMDKFNQSKQVQQ
ncbi:MAG: hypothetical protein U0929_02310 [Planctomycetaceae bacterium]